MASLPKKELTLKAIETARNNFPTPERKFVQVGSFSESYGLWSTSLKDLGSFAAKEGGMLTVAKKAFSNSMWWYQRTYALRGKANPLIHYIFAMAAGGFFLNVFNNEQQLHHLMHDVDARKKLNVRV
eukprot:TRINITY_DN70831_c0_g1_i1.p1 TRINITY_DN70831_c0_g1~~TRINITY_DN70831_c0_g1_i1.p1  ORF type:complete len:127 (-),score=15.04 TRINITY_DN70831_c0_g1_i1:95-475(-)